MPADEIAALLDPRRHPLQYHALVLEVTSQCNAACSMCYQSAGPAGSDVFGAATLGTDDLCRVLAEGRRIDAMDPRAHISGGEAFLRVEPIVEVVAEASRLGYREIITTTNATWARTPRRALRVATALRDAGLTAMAVSWDAWHLPYIRPDWVKHCLDACAEVGIPTQVRVLTTRDHGVAEALDALDADALGRVERISSGPVLPIGRGAQSLDPAQVFQVGSLSAACHTFLAVTVNPWGNVFPCCQG
ncbi:MAG: radical SAM protein, partial [Dactylosporangium sp.]|nr:radical SAM protein [Dactylosporangium sp.]